MKLARAPVAAGDERVRLGLGEADDAELVVVVQVRPPGRAARCRRGSFLQISHTIVSSHMMNNWMISRTASVLLAAVLLKSAGQGALRSDAGARSKSAVYDSRRNENAQQMLPMVCCAQIAHVSPPQEPMARTLVETNMSAFSPFGPHEISCLFEPRTLPRSHWGNTNRVVSNRVVSKGPLYPSNTKTVASLMFAG